MNLFRVACLYWNTLQLCLISRNCSVCSSVVFLCLPIHGIVSDSVVLLCSFGEFFFFFSFLGPINTSHLILWMLTSASSYQSDCTVCWDVPLSIAVGKYFQAESGAAVFFSFLCNNVLCCLFSLFENNCFTFFPVFHFLWQESKSSPSSGLVARNRDPPPNHPSNSFKSTWVITRALAIH